MVIPVNRLLLTNGCRLDLDGRSTTPGHECRQRV